MNSSKTNDREYENYDETSQTYDNFRIALDVDNLAGIIKDMSNKRGAGYSHRHLEIGVGTGNYMEALVKKFNVIDLTGIDLNQAQLAQAKKKLPDSVRLIHGDAMEMKEIFKGEKFDTISLPQVMHHIHKHEHEALLKECGAMLNDGGSLWIQTSFPHQQLSGYWWTHLVPEAALRVSLRFPTRIEFDSLLKTAGFAEVQYRVPSGTLMQTEGYLDVKGPLSKVYRNSDSTWSLATEEELKSGLEWWQKMVDSGKAKGLVEQWEGERKLIGQTTTVCATKAC